ncbi:MAG: Holliday junction branch migration DNA helicase RuvB [Actinobacteria bacterium]|nr:Holliday junction branch migration DNA helicase RuvB [Actinomycetota bacterium]MCL5072599.1 Holliday junction branch migration DNA helicase RuvB [Actinomycetota bacterium]
MPDRSPEEDLSFITPKYKKEDSELDKSLRPKSISDFIGQEKIVENLKIFIDSAKKRNEPLDHVILSGPPGLGKTCLAEIIANELGVNFKITSGPAIERAGDLAAILTNLDKFDVLFIDEMHRLNRVVEEILYPVMEDYKLDIIIGKGPSARSIRIDIAPFTIIGATTRIGLIAAPLRDRFGVHLRLDYYNIDSILKIIIRSAEILEMNVTEEGAHSIAKRSRGTPRIANRLLKRVRDYALIYGDGQINEVIAENALSKLDIDKLGLDVIDKKILHTIVTKFGGGPVGVGTIAVSIGEEVDTVEDVYEPYLLQLGFIKRTAKGRVATELAYKHLGIDRDDKEKDARLFK